MRRPRRPKVTSWSKPRPVVPGWSKADEEPQPGAPAPTTEKTNA